MSDDLPSRRAAIVLGIAAAGTPVITPASVQAAPPATASPATTTTAAPAPATPADAARAAEEERKALARLRVLRREPGGTGHFVTTIGFGKGLRFNNPYRLSTQLGEDAASLSLTATYLDVGLAGTYGAADGIQHGAALHLGGALHGVSQAYATPSYLATLRLDPRWLVLGRVGPTFLLSPDSNVGGELAMGAVFFGSAGLGLGVEGLLDMFYGAATLDSVASAIPIVSLQLELVVDLEVLP